MDLASRLVMANNGHLLSEAVQTGHGYDAATSYQMNQAAHYYYQIQKNSPLFRDLPEWTTYSPSDMHYAPRLTTNLNKAAKTAHNKNIATDLLEYQKSTSKRLVKQGQVTKPVDTSTFYDTPEFQDRKSVV